jgi:transposase
VGTRGGGRASPRRDYECHRRPAQNGEPIAGAVHARKARGPILAAGRTQDVAAVTAALTTPRSNAQTEARVTKLKLLTRQMYGRASFELLRRRVLPAA